MNPQAEPRLQKSETHEKVAYGFIDPCLVFFEANDQGFPVLVACWANASQDVKKPGEPALLELRHLLLFGWYPNTDNPTPWLFRTGGLDTLQITGAEPEIQLKAPEKDSPLDSLGLATLVANRIHVKHLTQDEIGWLAKETNHVSQANLILKTGGLTWPSISEASRSLSYQKEMKLPSHNKRKDPVKLGNLLTIADQIQAFGFARKTGEIFISNELPPARINLVDGEIVDAQFGLLSGIEAVIALINLKDPQTEFVVGERAHRRTIELPFTQVLCEAARIKDETPVLTQPVTPEKGAPTTPFLQITLGTEVKTYPLRPGITYIGRASRNDIVISDTTISQRHASFEYSPQGIFLKDLGSTNGTFVSGEAITEHWLGTRDSLQFGGVHCLFNGLKK